MSHQRFDGASVSKDFLPFHGWDKVPLMGLEEAVKKVLVHRISDYAGMSVDYADDYQHSYNGSIFEFWYISAS